MTNATAATRTDFETIGRLRPTGSNAHERSFDIERVVGHGAALVQHRGHGRLLRPLSVAPRRTVAGGVYARLFLVSVPDARQPRAPAALKPSEGGRAMRIPRTAVVRPELLPTRTRIAGSRGVFSAAAYTGGSASLVRPSGLCEIACNALPEPARSICKAAC